MQDRNSMPERIDDYVSRQFKERYEGITPPLKTSPEIKVGIPLSKELVAEQAVVSELNLLVKSKTGVTKQEVENVLAKAKTSINKYHICAQCMDENAGDIRKAHTSYLGGEKPPIDPELIPPEFIIRFNEHGTQLCLRHTAKFDLLPKTAKDYSIPADKIDFLIIDNKDWFKKEEIEKINENAKNINAPYRVITYIHKFYLKREKKEDVGKEEVEREAQALVFFDKKEFQEKFKRDRSEIEKQTFLRQLKKLQSINEPIAEQPQVNPEITSPEEELLPKGKLEMSTTEIRMEIKLGGEGIIFDNYPVIINNMLIRNGNGDIQIDTADTKKIIFRGKLAPANEISLSEKEKTELQLKREKAIRILIGNYRDISQMIKNNPEYKKMADKLL